MPCMGDVWEMGLIWSCFCGVREREWERDDRRQVNVTAMLRSSLVVTFGVGGKREFL